MKEDLVDKESLETKRAQHEQEAREKFKLISEQKAVRTHPNDSLSTCLLFLVVLLSINTVPPR